MENTRPTVKSMLETAALTTLLVLAAAAVLSWATGCKTTGPTYNTDLPLYEDTLWRAQAVQDLAYDLRCDDVFDFKADCASEPTQTRLENLKKVPEHVMEPLRARAVEINASWAGE